MSEIVAFARWLEANPPRTGAGYAAAWSYAAAWKAACKWQREQDDSALTAANTQIEDLQLRIRELETKLDRYTRMNEAGLSLGDHLDCIVDLGIEREVSDKLEAALEVLIDNGGIGPEDMFDNARAALAEVAHLRKQT